MLGSLAVTLNKTEKYAASKGIDVSTILHDRLIDDMLPMIMQVQIACDHAKGAVARVSGLENPKFDDHGQTVAELQSRIVKSADLL